MGVGGRSARSVGQAHGAMRASSGVEEGPCKGMHAGQEVRSVGRSTLSRAATARRGARRRSRERRLYKVARRLQSAAAVLLATPGSGRGPHVSAAGPHLASLRARSLPRARSPGTPLSGGPTNGATTLRRAARSSHEHRTPALLLGGIHDPRTPAGSRGRLLPAQARQQAAPRRPFPHSRRHGPRAGRQRQAPPGCSAAGVWRAPANRPAACGDQEAGGRAPAARHGWRRRPRRPRRGGGRQPRPQQAGLPHAAGHQRLPAAGRAHQRPDRRAAANPE